jgi:hypothetical protein
LTVTIGTQRLPTTGLALPNIVGLGLTLLAAGAAAGIAARASRPLHANRDRSDAGGTWLGSGAAVAQQFLATGLAHSHTSIAATPEAVGREHLGRPRPQRVRRR